MHRPSRRALLAAGALALARPAYAQGSGRLRIVIFGAPSLGAFLPPVIKARGLDREHGLDIEFVERTPDAYATQFNTGEFQVGGSAAPLTIGLADIRGVEVAYLLNLFDYWGAVVTSRPEIRGLRDLEGKDLAAARGTTNWTMFSWFARRAGADPAKFSVVNTATPGLVAYAMADRATAVQLWEPAYTLLKARKPEIRALDLNIPGAWREFAGSDQIPYLGVAAHRAWVAANAEMLPRLTATYRAAAAWLQSRPEEAAKLIAPRGGADEHAALASLVRANDRLGLNVRPIGALRREVEAVYRAGMEVGFLPRMPSAASIFDGTME